MPPHLDKLNMMSWGFKLRLWLVFHCDARYRRLMRLQLLMWRWRDLLCLKSWSQYCFYFWNLDILNASHCYCQHEGIYVYVELERHACLHRDIFCSLWLLTIILYILLILNPTNCILWYMKPFTYSPHVGCYFVNSIIRDVCNFIHISLCVIFALQVCAC